MTKFHPKCHVCGLKLDFDSYIEYKTEEPHTVERCNERVRARFKAAERRREAKAKRAGAAADAAQRRGHGSLFGGGS